MTSSDYHLFLGLAVGLGLLWGYAAALWFTAAGLKKREGDGA